MRAELDIRLRAGADGRVGAAGRLVAPPLWCRWDGATLWLVGSAASPVDEDRVRVHLDVGPGVHAVVRSVAAMVVYTAGPTGTRMDTHLEVASGASLHWAPEPVILTAHANHLSTMRVDVAGSATVHVDEVVVAGRHDAERSGRLVSELVLAVDDTVTLRSSFDTATPGWHGPGGTDGARCLGTRLSHDDALRNTSDGAPTAHGARLQPEGGGLLAMSLAGDPVTARRRLDELTPLAGPTGAPAAQPLVEMPPSSGMMAPVR